MIEYLCIRFGKFLVSLIAYQHPAIMPKFSYFSAILLSLALLASCNSSKKLLERGAYYQSVMSAVDKLQRSPNNKKSQNALRKAYPLAVRNFLNEIKKAKSDAVDMPWSMIADSYQSLNNMYEAINASPVARQIVSNPKEYYRQYAEVRENAAAEQYEIAEQLMSLNTREDAKQAYFHYRAADEFQQGYRDVVQKLQDAKAAATLTVLVEMVPVPSRLFQVSADFFYEQVDNHLRELMGRNEFVAFYSDKDARRIGLDQPDQKLTLQFEDFNVGQSRAFQNKETIEMDSVEVGEVTLENGRKRPVMGTVKATLVTRRLEVLSNGILSMTINDGLRNTRIYRDEMPGEFLWFAEWATFQGDERALTEEQLELCELGEATPPQPQEMFVEFTHPIFNDLTQQLNRYYQNI